MTKDITGNFYEQGDTRMMQVLKKKLRHHSLTGRIVDTVMLKAFKNVKRNKGAAGIDKVSIKMYEANLKENLDSLMRELKTDSYCSISTCNQKRLKMLQYTVL